MSIGTHWPSGSFVNTSYIVYQLIYLASILIFYTRLHASMARCLQLDNYMSTIHSQQLRIFIDMIRLIPVESNNNPKLCYSVQGSLRVVLPVA